MRLIDADMIKETLGATCVAARDNQGELIALGGLDIIPTVKLSNQQWIDFLVEQFSISRTSAKEMLHGMMYMKREDNFKKQFSGKR